MFRAIFITLIVASLINQSFGCWGFSGTSTNNNNNNNNNNNGGGSSSSSSSGSGNNNNNNNNNGGGSSSSSSSGSGNNNNNNNNNGRMDEDMGKTSHDKISLKYLRLSKIFQWGRSCVVYF